jgi:hypothetical protein
MIALADVIGMCGLSEAEVDAIARHEHVPEIAAAAIASYLMHAHHGPAHVQTMICEDIRNAIQRDDVGEARRLFMALRAFVADHPEAIRGSE